MMNHLEEWYDYEQMAIKALTVIMTLFFAGIALHEFDIGNPLSDFVYQYYLNPIIGESTGDSGYNMVNTMTYGIVLAMFAVALSGWLRHLGIDGSDMTLLALLPFVLWAALGEVVEDAQMFGEVLSAWFVSPGVHFQTAGWVVLSGAAGYSIINNNDNSISKYDRVNSISIVLISSQFLIYGISISGSNTVESKEIDLTLFAIFGILGVLTPIWLKDIGEFFDDLQRTVYFTGVGGSLVLFGGLASYMSWAPSDQLNFWPVVVVIGLPIAVAYFMIQQGRESSMKLASLGIVAGVLPPGMTEDDYLASESEEKDLIESLRLKATMAYPVAFLPVAGQLLDGLATYIGIDFFPYSEKHVVSAAVIDLFDTAATFAVLKLIIGGIILWFYSLANFEHRQQHLRLLIGLALMVVGMAPGLRDVGRLMLGV
jgi:uncharacterized membrane protein